LNRISRLGGSPGYIGIVLCDRKGCTVFPIVLQSLLFQRAVRKQPGATSKKHTPPTMVVLVSVPTATNYNVHCYTSYMVNYIQRAVHTMVSCCGQRLQISGMQALRKRGLFLLLLLVLESTTTVSLLNVGLFIIVHVNLHTKSNVHLGVILLLRTPKYLAQILPMERPENLPNCLLHVKTTVISNKLYGCRFSPYYYVLSCLLEC
jgi:hypothetical protein